MRDNTPLEVVTEALRGNWPMAEEILQKLDEAGYAVVQPSQIIKCLSEHRFDDSSTFDEIFCHEPGDSPMIGIKRGPNAQTDWEEWVEHVAPILTARLT